MNEDTKKCSILNGSESMFASFSDPFETLFGLQRALESRIASDWMGRGTAASGSFPPINIFQKGDDFVAVVELPGIDKNDLEIEAKESTIRLRGRKVIAYGERASVHRRERISGVFDRTLSVPIRIEPDRIKAEYRDGVLALFIPRAETDKPRSIKVS
jgi:HSP20 family protein